MHLYVGSALAASHGYQILKYQQKYNRPHDVYEAAFGTRNQNMHLSYPMKEQHLRECSIFRPCPVPMLRQFLRKA